ncbi:MAG TPA: A/G-specific adenine glycosylase [Cytophagales bacterium]|nr:A/G-specific adenine glycosylase [Cytophagales bacterium]
MDAKIFRERLLGWYQEHQRDLPWRHTRDPYPIWLSEIILQQTRVAQGLPYWEKFMQAFPTLPDLASAEEQQVLRLWQGLGYYSRARNLHACAKQVMEEYNGQFPRTYDELLKLKGVGKYTAAAIAYFAFGEAVPVVDGNVYRLFSRVFGIETDIASSKAFNEFFNLGLELIDTQRAGAFNQASMEFGATYCKPQNPPCLTCTFASGCHALATGQQAKLPVKIKKTKVKDRYFHYLVFVHADQVLVRTRPVGDIWTGLHDFHLVETTKPATPDEWPTDLGKLLMGHSLKGGDVEYKHLLSHRRLHARFYEVNVPEKDAFEGLATQLEMQAVTWGNLENLAKPVLILRFLNDREI